jgi:hypothetical protein
MQPALRTVRITRSSAPGSGSILRRRLVPRCGGRLQRHPEDAGLPRGRRPLAAAG